MMCLLDNSRKYPCIPYNEWYQYCYPLAFENSKMLNLYLPTLKHYVRVSRLGNRDIDLTHQGQFLTPDSQIWTSCSKKTSFYFRFVMYYFFAPYNNRKSFQMSTTRLNRKCSKVVGISLSIFGNVRKSSEDRQKSSEVARTFPEIPFMTTKISRI